MRSRRDLQLEPQVVASINRHRRRRVVLRAGAVIPLVAGVLVALALFLYEAARGGGVSGSDFDYGNLGLWIVFAIVAVLFTSLTLVIGPEKIPIVENAGADLEQYGVFREALDGVSIGVGIHTPPALLVLDLPTVNALSLIQGGRTAIGVTRDALSARVPRRHAEAMMAHELAHTVSRDVIIGSNRGRWRLMGTSLAGALVLPFVLLGLSYGFSVWLFVSFLCWTGLMIIDFRVLGQLLYRQNDLLADSIAAKLTGDPQSLKEAIARADEILSASDMPFPPGARYPELLFVYEERPELEVAATAVPHEVVDEALELELEVEEAEERRRLARKGFPRVTIAQRVANLEAIERGHWREFER